jgi:hypothetical protein
MPGRMSAPVCGQATSSWQRYLVWRDSVQHLGAPPVCAMLSRPSLSEAICGVNEGRESMPGRRGLRACHPGAGIRPVKLAMDDSVLLELARG